MLFVCSADLVGPSEKQALWFARELASRGHRAALGLCGDPANGVSLDKSDLSEGVEVIWQSYRGRRLTGPSLDRARTLAPDVIHAWSSRPAVVAAARSYHRVTGAPIFLRWEDDEWGRAGTPDPMTAAWARHLARRVVGRFNPPVCNISSRWSLRNATRWARAHDALTPTLANEVRKRTGRPCTVLLPAAPPEAWEASSAQAPQLPPELGGSALLYTGNIGFGREPDVGLGLAAIAQVQRRGLRATFVHAGRSTGGDLDAMAHQAGMIPGSVVSLGELPYSRIPPLLREATILLQPGLPSNFNRFGLPSKLQSYLASGTPCITFAVGSGELLEDRREVLKTYTGEPTELAERIVELLTDDDLRATLSRKGPRAARRLFDPVRNTDTLLAHYDRELRGRGGAQPGQRSYSVPARAASVQ